MSSVPFPAHVEGMEDVISLLLDSEKGVIQDKSEISAIGHRVLHGGEAITDPVLIDEKVKEIIRDCFPLGPLHNPANLMGIDVAEKLFPGVPNVGVFDTEFGMTLASRSVSVSPALLVVRRAAHPPLWLPRHLP